MASYYEREKSPYYWLNYRDPESGKVTQKSSKIRVDNPDGKREIKKLVAKWTQKEMTAPRTREKERWEFWVDAYLRERYSAETNSLKSMLSCFRDILIYFKERGVSTPRQMTYQLTADFFPWMKMQKSKRTKQKLMHNSAHNRIACLSVLLSEAVRRGYCEHNYCRDLQVRRVKGKEKPEITFGHQAIIESELPKRQQWMQDQWIVLMRQGCRVAETNVPLDRVDEQAMALTFKIKGGRLHTAGMHEDVLALARRAKADGRASLLKDPPAVPSWSPAWKKFFQDLNMPYSAHCTRVTVITRLLRAGHSPALVSALVGHSEEVNRIYRRLKPPDARALLNTLSAVATPSVNDPTLRNPHSPMPSAHGIGSSFEVLGTEIRIRL